MAAVPQDALGLANAQIARAKQIIADSGWDLSGRFDQVKAAIASAERQQDPTLRLRDANAAVDGAVTMAGLPSYTDELEQRAKDMVTPEAGGAYDRLYQAALLGVQDPIVLERIGQEAFALLTPANLQIIAILLGVWAAGTFFGGIPAWAANVVVWGVGLYTIGKGIVDASINFGNYAKTAWSAKSDAEIRQAGKFFAVALGEVGGVVITTLVTGAAFRAVRVAVAKIGPMPRAGAVRPGPAPGGGRTGPLEGPVAEPGPQESAPRERTPTPQDSAPRERTAEERAADENRPREETQDRPPQDDVLSDAVRGQGVQGLANGMGSIVAVGVALAAAAGLGLLLLSRKRQRRQRE